MRNRSITSLAALVCLILVFNTAILAGDYGRIEGTVTDKETGEPIPGTSVLVVGTVFGAASDPSGHFRINRLAPGTYTLWISQINYESLKLHSVVVAPDSATEVAPGLTKCAIGLYGEIRIISWDGPPGSRPPKNMIIRLNNDPRDHTSTDAAVQFCGSVTRCSRPFPALSVCRCDHVPPFRK